MNQNFQSLGLDKDWKYGFVDNRFVLQLTPATHTNLSYKEACMLRADRLFKNLKNPVLAIGGGVDSQIVLNCFYDQGYKIDCVFRHYKHKNTFELDLIQQLQKKYNFNLIQIDIEPDVIKNEIIEEYKKTDIHPIELIYKKFVSMLPDEVDIIQGIEGPFVVKGDKALHYLDSYNTFGFLRRRAVNLLGRKGNFINFEKNSNILLATMEDDIYNSFLETYNYFEGHQFTKELKNNLIDQWDLYIKPFLYHKHWKKDIMYFPKYMGSEAIPWLNSYRTFYRQRMILIELNELKDFLKSNKAEYKNFYEHKFSFQDTNKEIQLRKMNKQTYPITMLGEPL